MKVIISVTQCASKTMASVCISKGQLDLVHRKWLVISSPIKMQQVLLSIKTLLFSFTFPCIEFIILWSFQAVDKNSSSGQKLSAEFCCLWRLFQICSCIAAERRSQLACSTKTMPPTRRARAQNHAAIDPAVLNALTVAERRNLCRERKIPFTGNRNSLVNRLRDSGSVPPALNDERTQNQPVRGGHDSNAT